MLISYPFEMDTLSYNSSLTSTVSLPGIWTNEPLINISLREQKNTENAVALLPVIIFVSLMMAFGFIGNSLVIYVYMIPRIRAKRTTQRTFILTLAIFDVLNCILVIPFEIYDMCNQYNFTSDSLCKSFRFIETVLVLSSGFTLLSISIDRYVHLVKTSRNILTVRRAKILATCCVILATLFAWPMLLLAGAEEFEFQMNGYTLTGIECNSVKDNATTPLDSTLYYYSLMITFVSALVAMIVFYTLIGIKLFKRRHGSTKNGLHYVSANKEGQNLKPMKHTMRLSSVGYAIGKQKTKVKSGTIIFYSVTFVFVLGFVPHLTARLLRLLKIAFLDKHKEDANEVLYNLLTRSYVIINAANPFIYSILNPRFRTELLATFKKCFCYKK